MANGNGKDGVRQCASRATRRAALGAASGVAVLAMGAALAAGASGCFLRALPGLGSGAGLPGQSAPADPAAVRGVFPLGAIEQAAHDFQDTVGAAGDLEAALTRLLPALGVPIVPVGDAAEARARLDAGDIVVLEPEIASIARALRRGITVGLDDELAALGKRGAGLTGPAEPLTAAALGSRIAALEGAGKVTLGAARLAFVAALGRERVRRAGLPADGVWGEPQLDLLQLVLLGRAFRPPHAHPSSGVAAAAATGIDWSDFVAWAAGQTGGGAAPAEADFVTPLPDDSAKAVVFDVACARQILGSYELGVDAAPAYLWRRELDDPSKPYRADVTATLTVRDPEVSGSDAPGTALLLAMLRAGGCPLPKPGPAAGVSLDWWPSSALAAHGAIAARARTTDAAGQAKATYETLPEALPRELRKVRHETYGSVGVSAVALLPGGIAARYARPDRTAPGWAQITVAHYTLPEHLSLRFWSHTQTVAHGKNGDTTIDSWVASDVTLSLISVGEGAGRAPHHYEGEAPLRYTAVKYKAAGTDCSLPSIGVGTTMHFEIPVAALAGDARDVARVHYTLGKYPAVPAEQTTVVCPKGTYPIPPVERFFYTAYIFLHKDEMPFALPSGKGAAMRTAPLDPGNQPWIIGGQLWQRGADSDDHTAHFQEDTSLTVVSAD